MDNTFICTKCDKEVTQTSPVCRTCDIKETEFLNRIQSKKENEDYTCGVVIASTLVLILIPLGMV